VNRLILQLASAVAVDDAEEEGDLTARHEVLEHGAACGLRDHAVEPDARPGGACIEQGRIRLGTEAIDEHVGCDVAEPDLTQPEGLGRGSPTRHDLRKFERAAAILFQAVADRRRDKRAVDIDVDDARHHPARPALQFERGRGIVRNRAARLGAAARRTPCTEPHCRWH
jgi:hypothetical protein